MRAAYPDAEILAHPECPTEGDRRRRDFTGSTAAMTDYIAERKPARVVMITECSMADNIACESPGVEFVRPCNLCPHMKRITLTQHPRRPARRAVRGDGARAEVAERARAAVQRMIDLPPPAVPARYDLVKARHHVDVELI